MIPKIIHYCWFGNNEKPELSKKCIQSWKKLCPEYEIIEWNENNFDINLNGYTKWCYENKKYAFLSDYVRLWIVYHKGGLYFDTDVELVKSPNFLLNNQSFFGFETKGMTNTKGNKIMNYDYVATGLGFGSIAKGIAVKAMLNEYDSLLDGKNGIIMCPKLNTEALVRLGLRRNGLYQEFSWGTIYSKEYFNPYDSLTEQLIKTKNTVSIHWYMGSCLTTIGKIRFKLGKMVRSILGMKYTRKSFK